MIDTKQDLTEYLELLESKKRRVVETGFHVEQSDLHPELFGFQRYIVQRGLKAGRFANLSGTGTGKTFEQLEWSNRVVRHTGKSVLILAPLCVTDQTIEQGQRWGIPVLDLNTEQSTENLSPGIYITNYENLDNISYPEVFAGIVLDEASILKSFDGATRNKIITTFRNTPYKFPCTATPAPNDPMEIGNYAEFLGVMTYTEMLAMYFVHDGGDTAKWRLKGHAKQAFYDWVSTWAVMLSKPSDIGFSAEGYDLPPLNLIEREIKTPERGNAKLFNDVSVSATDFNKELRLTKIERLGEVADIVNNSSEIFIIWIKQDEEGDYLRNLIPDAIEVRGSQPAHYKKKTLLEFANGMHRVLITKSRIAGYGMNLQVCHNQIFASLDFSFEALFQSIMRSLRFGQEHAVNVWLITTDTMQNVRQAIERKWKEYIAMQSAMTKAVNKNLNAERKAKKQRTAMEHKTENCHLFLGDCVQLIQDVPDKSIGFSMFSLPFLDMYVYSDEIEDMGNCRDYDEFFAMFDHLTRGLFRVIQDGRIVAVDCMDVPIQKGKHGYIGTRDFPGDIIRSFERAGFIYDRRVTCWRNPVTEMQRTKSLQLLHKQIKKDSSMSSVGLPNYILKFRHPAENQTPIVNQDTDPSKPNYLPVDLWQKYASPVWMDINWGDTLNRQDAREEGDERHIAPLTLEAVARCLHLWSNEGDTILEPFGGIGTVPFKALQMKRKALAFELKKSYFTQMVKNCTSAEIQKLQATLELY